MANLKDEIFCMINKINNGKDLEEIAKLCKEKIAISLDDYINEEFKCAPNNVKNKFKCEVINYLCELENNEIKIDPNPCGDWCDLTIGGYDLTDWIASDYPVFNPLRLAICVYKIWNNEVIIE